MKIKIFTDEEIAFIQIMEDILLNAETIEDVLNKLDKYENLVKVNK